jgi:hypothetical protein
MAGVPKPDPCYFDSLSKWRVIEGRQVWASHEGFASRGNRGFYTPWKSPGRP